MPKANLAEIIFVLDKSGSMESIRRETIAGFNGFVRSQISSPGDARMTLILFDTNYSVAFAGVPLKEVVDLNPDSYAPSGGTALLDAVGTAIDRTGKRLAGLTESQRPAKVMMVVLTDGEENSSRECTVEDVRGMVRHQSDVYSWEFLFLGANQDARTEAGKMGMERAMDFVADEEGVAFAYARVSEAVREFRGGKNG